MFVESSLQPTLAVTVFSVVISTVLGCTPSDNTDMRARAHDASLSYDRGGERMVITEIPGTNQRYRRSVSALPTEDAAALYTWLDLGEDGEIDACEWMRTLFDTRIGDFANLLEDIDLDGDDSVCMNEFKDLKVVIHRAEGTTAPPTTAWHTQWVVYE